MKVAKVLFHIDKENLALFFYEPNTIFILKFNKDCTKKKTTGQYCL